MIWDLLIDLGVTPFASKEMLESNTLKPRFLVHGLAVQSSACVVLCCAAWVITATVIKSIMIKLIMTDLPSSSVHSLVLMPMCVARRDRHV